jgi:type VI secretion system protein ImpK
VASGPAAGTGDLSQRNLGGEKFFQLLARLSQNPREHIVLLGSLIFACCLKVAIGSGQWPYPAETIKQRLWQMIRGVRGNYPPPLSPHPKISRFCKLWRPMIPVGLCGPGRVSCLPVLHRS